MNPFVSEHDAPAEDARPMQQMPVQNIRRKPLSTDRNNTYQPTEANESWRPDPRDRESYDVNQHFEFPTRPSLRETVSADSLQVETRTANDEDVSPLEEDHDRPRIQEMRPLSQSGLEVVPARTQDDALPPESAKKTRQHGFKEHAKAWGVEFGWVLLAIALFIALVIVLRMYDNKGLPQWPMGFTLNTLVAFLATMCRSVIIIPIGEGLSQLKWNWFVAKKRPIKDLNIFDQASRGPWGSIRLIFRMKGRLIPLSHLASVILIAGLVTSFLTQSTISYSERVIDRDVPASAVAKRALSYYIDAGTEKRQDAIDALEQNVFQAAFLNVDTTWPDAEPRCSGANCTWPVFSSIGVCATISNITDQLRVEKTRDEFRKDALNASLPLLNGTAYLFENTENAQPFVNMTSPEPLDYVAQINMTDPDVSLEEYKKAIDDAYRWPPERESLSDWGNKDLLGASFSQFFFIFANDNVSPGSGDRYRAAELLWHFCVYDYNISVTAGEPKTEIINVETKIDSVQRASEDVEVNTFWMSNKEGNETFPVREEWEYTRLDLDFRRAFAGAHSTSWGTDATYSEFNRQFGLNLYYGINSDMDTKAVDNKMWSNLGRLTTNIARSVTTFMRNEEVTGDVIGKTPVQETFITVRWEWLSFLAAQIGLTLVFLFAIIFHTASLDIDIVKSSNISELFATHGVDDAHRRSSDEQATEDTALLGIKSKLDKTVQGRLIREGVRWRLDVGRERPPDVKYQ